MRASLDTSAYSAFKRNHPDAVSFVRQCEEIVVSVTVAGELLSRFRHGSRFTENFAELQEFLRHPRVRLIPITLITADRYGRIYAAIRRKGRH